MLRLPTPVSDEVEQRVHDTIGCCIEVHRELGPGLPEHAYARALSLAFSAAKIPFEREKRYAVHFRGEFLCHVFLDFVVSDSIVVEIKAVDHLAPLHHSQTLNYMRISRTHIGLLVNFNVTVLKDGIRRKVL
jgi:GxxExxY protein